MLPRRIPLSRKRGQSEYQIGNPQFENDYFVVGSAKLAKKLFRIIGKKKTSLPVRILLGVVKQRSQF